MITFRKVVYKNFLSTGNTPTEIDLDKHSTTLVIGDNGSGKSTMLDALCFGLFGKAFRNIKKDQLVNSVNERDCKVEVHFQIGRAEYLIIRGINLFVLKSTRMALCSTKMRVLVTTRNT